MLKAALTITLLLAAVLSAVSVSADGNSYMVSFPVTVSNPNNNIPEDTTFTLIIEGPAALSASRSFRNYRRGQRYIRI